MEYRTVTNEGGKIYRPVSTDQFIKEKAATFRVRSFDWEGVLAWSLFISAIISCILVYSVGAEVESILNSI